MEAGNGMPFQLRQLLCMSTSFKTLGKSCKCSSNEFGLSATSKHIPAAPKCLFAVGLSGDCVNCSAFKGTCQEKFRSSTRQWHWNAAFSRTVTYINPEKKPPPQFLFLSCVGSVSPSRLLTFWYLSARDSLQSLHKATNRTVFPTGMFEDGLLVGDQLPRHSTASLTCQAPPAGYASISCPGCRGLRGWATPGLQCRSVALKEQWPAQSSTQPDCQAHHSQFHKAWLNRGLVQRGCNPIQLSHLSGPGTVGVTYPHLGGHLGESAHWWLLVEPSKRSPNLCSCTKLSNRNTCFCFREAKKCFREAKSQESQ